MIDPQAKIEELASLMDEFGLAEANFQEGDLRIRFARKRKAVVSQTSEVAQDFEPEAAFIPAQAIEPPKPLGTPVTSPMNGIFYNAPSPGSPPFVKVGDQVTAGQIIGLIEAMKVFNEIPCPVSGTVLSINVEPSAVVQPGDAILHIG
jgi:acetyl-CoA carboxylase biotin carboxyl carrier protein